MDEKKFKLILTTNDFPVMTTGSGNGLDGFGDIANDVTNVLTNASPESAVFLPCELKMNRSTIVK